MLGSGNLEKHLIRLPCNKTPPSVNGFIKTIYGKLFKMSLEFDRTGPFQRAHREQSVQRLKLVSSPVQPFLYCPILPFLSLYSLCWTDRDKNTGTTLQSWEPSRAPSRTFLHLGLWLISPRSHGSSWLGKDFCLTLIVMWYSAYSNGRRVVSGRHMWGNVTAVSNTYCARFSQVGISHSEDDTKSKMCYH